MAVSGGHQPSAIGRSNPNSPFVLSLSKDGRALPYEGHFLSPSTRLRVNG